MNSTSLRKIAIVIPWFGRDQRGGAEQQAWQLAVRLAARGFSVEVLTTCCGSFHSDWSTNRLPPGVVVEPEGFAIRRFPVETRDRPAFDRVCGHLLSLKVETLKPGVSPISAEDERIFAEHLIRCPALLAYLRTDGWRYHAFVFLPYLYGPILDGLPLVASRAYLLPCLHDESYAYLRCVQRAVYKAKGLLWLSEGEFELGRRLFGPSVLAKSTVGLAGVEPSAVVDETLDVSPLARFKPFALLLGRKDRGKGTLLAADAFRSYRQSPGADLRLVIAGPGELTLGEPDTHIHDLGLVDEATRTWLLHNATLLLQPSPNESFSRVIFEAWQCDKPVVVRRTCLATACAVEASGGGWTAETPDEWSKALASIEALTAAERDAIGRRGHAYTRSIADWDRVMERFDRILGPVSPRPETTLRFTCRLSAEVAQEVRLFADDLEVGSWRLEAGQIHDTGWLERTCSERMLTLRFESDRPGQKLLPDPRTLGFRLVSLEVRDAQFQTPLLTFVRGWNRSEAGPGKADLRWSTGSAEVLVDTEILRADRPSIHQVLPNLGYGDAIGNATVWIRDRLQAMGYTSEIYARHIAGEMLHQAYHLTSPETLPPDATVLYHHSIGTEITPWICAHPGPKALVYHNITPARFFEPYRPEFAETLRHGREQLLQLAGHFPTSAGVSRFNATELAANGFRDPGILPLCIDPAHWGYAPDEKVMEELQDGRTNILFVGRIAPNKRHEELIYTFKFWLEDDPTARLLLVGTAEVSSFYLECLQELTRKLRVEHAVQFVGHVNDAQLNAYYRCASMFWCMSEHEGFCVPLIEACAFGLPIFARAEGAVPETLGQAGVLLPERLSPPQLARFIAQARDRGDRRARIEQVSHFDAAHVTRSLQTLIDRLDHAHAVIVR